MYILSMSRKMVSIREAAEFLGVAAQTLRRWEREGKLIPDERTPGAGGGAMTWRGCVPSSSMRPKRVRHDLKENHQKWMKYNWVIEHRSRPRQSVKA